MIKLLHSKYYLLMNDTQSAFKLWINKGLLERMAESISTVYADFDRQKLIHLAPKLDSLELKDRVRRVRDELRCLLPQKYRTALKILIMSLDAGNLKGFDLWPYTEFIQTYGIEDLDASLPALKKITPLFTSEFAIRPFIRKYPEQALSFLKSCAKDSNVHVRRWASEGSRARLPWGEKLEILIQNPTLTLEILETLKHDPDLYVRKSVSNHLNDLAKDHADWVIEVLSRWKLNCKPAHAKKINWIIYRSLRNLIKKGHPKAMNLIGVNCNAKVKVTPVQLNKKFFRLNDTIEFNFAICSIAKKQQKIIIDYIIHHVKANKETTPKIFKLKNILLEPNQKISILKKHSLKKITTRKYYPGVHLLEIQVNGKVLMWAEWTLSL